MAKPVILLVPLPPTEMGFGKAGSNHARHIYGFRPWLWCRGESDTFRL